MRQEGIGRTLTRIPVTAYSPLEEGRLVRRRALVEFAKSHGMTPAQVAIAWLMARDGVIAIPKTNGRKRLEENALALEHPLTTAQLKELDALFPRPKGPSPLEMIFDARYKRAAMGPA